MHPLPFAGLDEAALAFGKVRISLLHLVQLPWCESQDFVITERPVASEILFYLVEQRRMLVRPLIVGTRMSKEMACDLANV
jgi:hypothetical protein